MEKEQVTTTVAKQKKRSMSQLSASRINVTDLKDYRRKPRKTLSIKLKDSTLRGLPNAIIDAEQHVEKNDDCIEKIAENKEKKLLNLIVKVIVKSILEQLYGKEGY